MIELIVLLVIAAVIIIPINLCGMGAREEKKYILFAAGLFLLLAGACVPVFLLKETPFSLSVSSDGNGAPKHIAIKQTPYETTFDAETINGHEAVFKDSFGHHFSCVMPNRFASGETELKLTPMDATLVASYCYIKHLNAERYLVLNKDTSTGVMIVLGVALYGFVAGTFGYFMFPKPSFGL